MPVSSSQTCMDLHLPMHRAGKTEAALPTWDHAVRRRGAGQAGPSPAACPAIPGAEGKHIPLAFN